ncbi:MAG: sugar phosphate isomerase/epimerase, partial [Phycisphaerae bacterium]|nr:sugar phosphate isomerase/epimerase [Phycisphaerae bacterium]
VNAFTLFADGDTYHPTWIEDNPPARQRRIDHTIAAIELAAEFSASTVSIQPGGPLIGATLTRDTAGERFADGLRQVLPIAQRRNVTIAIEPEPGLFIQSSAEYLEFKNRFFPGEPRIRMNCDVGHLFCIGESPSQVIADNPSEIAHVHLEDIGEDRVHQHRAPGKGIIDFRAIFEALGAMNYPGWVTIELYPYEATAAEVAHAAIIHLRHLIER